MPATSLSPSLNEIQSHLPDLVLFTCVMSFRLPFQHMILHRKKRLRAVNIPKDDSFFYVHCKAKAKPVKPGSAYHDETVPIPRMQGTCVICAKKIRWYCFGCCKELPGIYPVCSPSVRNCDELHHRARNEI